MLVIQGTPGSCPKASRHAPWHDARSSRVSCFAVYREANVRWPASIRRKFHDTHNNTDVAMLYVEGPAGMDTAGRKADVPKWRADEHNVLVCSPLSALENMDVNKVCRDDTDGSLEPVRVADIVPIDLHMRCAIAHALAGCTSPCLRVQVRVSRS
jgi:hypothetical protein